MRRCIKCRRVLYPTIEGHVEYVTCGQPCDCALCLVCGFTAAPPADLCTLVSYSGVELKDIDFIDADYRGVASCMKCRTLGDALDHIIVAVTKNIGVHVCVSCAEEILQCYYLSQK